MPSAVAGKPYQPVLAMSAAHGRNRGGGEARRVRRSKVKHGLAHHGDAIRELGEQGGRPRAGGDDARRADLGALPADGDAGVAHLAGEVGHVGAALGPPRARVHVAVREAAPAVRPTVVAGQSMPARGEHGVAVALEGPGREGTSRQDEQAVAVVARIGLPPGHGPLHELRVQRVAAVVGADELADVGARREWIGRHSLLDDDDLATAVVELEGCRQPEHASADDGDHGSTQA